MPSTKKDSDDQGKQQQYKEKQNEDLKVKWKVVELNIFKKKKNEQHLQARTGRNALRRNRPCIPTRVQ